MIWSAPPTCKARIYQSYSNGTGKSGRTSAVSQRSGVPDTNRAFHHKLEQAGMTQSMSRAVPAEIFPGRRVGHLQLCAVPVRRSDARRDRDAIRRGYACGKGCRELLRSLLRDKDGLNDALAKGVSVTITHESVLRVFRKCGNIHIDAEPQLLYRDTLRSILRRQTYVALVLSPVPVRSG